MAGRNNQGRITVRHRGGGAKRRIRIIDFKRDKVGVPGRVAAIEYDPGRTARIALIHYRDGEKRYILAPVGLKVGDDDPVRPGRGSQGRQHAAAAEHAERHGDPQHRADAGPRRRRSCAAPARRRS